VVFFFFVCFLPANENSLACSKTELLLNSPAILSVTLELKKPSQQNAVAIPSGMETKTEVSPLSKHNCLADLPHVLQLPG